MSFIDLITSESFKPVLIILAVWDLVWKSIAMWRAAKNDSKTWFVVLMLVNSIGILPIVYILINKHKQKQL